MNMTMLSRRILAKYLDWAVKLRDRNHSPQLINEFFEAHPLLKSAEHEEALIALAPWSVQNAIEYISSKGS